ncbi:hypothetical protein NG895_01210 [Aeoliella sp. ICT_H6.2]|uniref:Dockerin domain-containing protein n=1 Tax=Aeoliella straminimaris TaxID=2954799 RepID=A0A9X2F5D0_9BACT|nr:hypothetical protein [Aeoliella straminimaris]MCO6042515.1 hypothetical protein [Aeoliella straminimaris]
MTQSIGRPCCVAILTLLFSTGWSAARADIFPDPSIPQDSRSGTDRYNGLKKVLMMVVHDVDSPLSTEQWDNRVDTHRQREEQMRSFYATNSGGQFDFYFDDIIDTPIELNDDNTRPSNFYQLANNVAQGLGKNLSDYYLFAYDIGYTTNDTGWSGLSTSNRIYLQSIRTQVTQHEIGHQVGVDHAKAFVTRNDSNFHPYTWNEQSQQYEEYIPGVSPYDPMPFGVASYEYSNPFDTMGNISTGDFRIREKVSDVGWISESQFPRVDGEDGLGEGVHRIYAHDELQSMTDGLGNYGVVEGYAAGVNYGLQYQRLGQYFDTDTGTFLAETQTIDIEYRSGADGVQFYLSGEADGDNRLTGALVDIDSETNSRERLLEIGSSIEDTEFGMSRFIVDAGAVGQSTPTIDFLDYNPPAPTILAGSWWNITAIANGVDAIGSWIDLEFELISPLNGLAGDLNQDRIVNQDDIDLFLAGWMTDTLNMSSIDKYYHGDLDFSGLTDLTDLNLMHQAVSTAMGTSSGLQVPEASSAAIAVACTLLLGAVGYTRRGSSL